MNTIALVLIAAVVLLLLAMAWFRPPSKAAQLDRALKKKAKGELASLQALADEGLGDAAYELFLTHDAAGDLVGALAALKSAVAARTWVNYSSLAWNEYARRRFLGIGAEPDHAALLAEWSEGYEPGYQWEHELAWIQTCGPQALRNHEQAWHWLCLGQARWGEGHEAQALSAGVVAQVRQTLLEAVPPARREQLMEQAERTAHAEFIAGK